MVKIGCQTYAWEMLGDRWRGTVDDILDAVAAAGYEGIEITNTMIGNYYDRPADFDRTLEERGLAVDVHPHSHAGSIIESAGEYDQPPCTRRGRCTGTGST